MDVGPPSSLQVYASMPVALSRPHAGDVDRTIGEVQPEGRGEVQALRVRALFDVLPPERPERLGTLRIKLLRVELRTLQRVGIRAKHGTFHAEEAPPGTDFGETRYNLHVAT